jgi:hypothetical protein
MHGVGAYLFFVNGPRGARRRKYMSSVPGKAVVSTGASSGLRPTVQEL